MPFIRLPFNITRSITLFLPKFSHFCPEARDEGRSIYTKTIRLNFVSLTHSAVNHRSEVWHVLAIDNLQSSPAFLRDFWKLKADLSTTRARKRNVGLVLKMNRLRQSHFAALRVNLTSAGSRWNLLFNISFTSRLSRPRQHPTHNNIYTIRELEKTRDETSILIWCNLNGEWVDKFRYGHDAEHINVENTVSS